MAMPADSNLSPINDLRDNLISHLPDQVQRIVIYGSYARGDIREDSDLDVMVILDDDSPAVVEKARTIRYEVMQQHQYHPLISLLLLSEDDWKALSKRSVGLKQNIEREGITIWSRA